MKSIQEKNNYSFSMMKKSYLLRSLSLIIALGSLSTALQAATVADSVSEFSGVQGQDSWFYGQYSAFNPSGFAQLTSFNGTQWEGSQLFNTPYLNASGGHPGTENLNWAVRRWVSEVTGPVTISGNFYDLDTSGGDGSNIRIYLNSSGIFSSLNIPSSTTPFSLTASINLGDSLDFVIDPRLDPVADATHFTALISSTVPIPPSVWLFGSGLLGLVGIARRTKAAQSLK